MQAFIVTGASRGLGEALACALAEPRHELLTLARGDVRAVVAAAQAAGSRHEHWNVDLAHAPEAAERLERWLAERHGHFPGGATLINNAGLLGPVGPIDQAPVDAIDGIVQVNLEAPILLTRAFLRATAGWRVPRRVLQISSGAARNAYAGWSLYCATKAGLDHFTRAAALDEARRPDGARLVSLAPGVVDTAMQAELRGANPAGFPDLPRFLGLKAGGQLAAPGAAARRILAYLDRADFGANPVADVRDAA